MAVLQKAQLQTDGETLVLSLWVEPAGELPHQLRAALVLHDDIMVDSFAWWCECERKADTWVGRLQIGSGSGQARLLELANIVDPAGVPVSMPAAHLFLERPGNAAWTTGADAEAEKVRLAAKRDAYFNAPIVGAAATGADPTFSIVLLADNLRLTKIQRIPGIQVIPLASSTVGIDVAHVLNDVMRQLRFGSGINLDKWMESMQDRRPAAIVHAPRVQAADHSIAVKACLQSVHPLLDLLALRRGDSPRLLGGVAATADRNGVMQCMAYWVAGAGYAGNVLGGMTSGEDPHTLVRYWNALSKDPRTKLWLALYADAIADDRWDYRLFRCFNLLEGIATEIVPDNVVIRDGTGKPRLMPDKKPYTTRHARGKVYELLRGVAAKGQEAESNFTAPLQDGSSAELWDEVEIWVAVRNSVAHRGSWELPTGERPTAAHSSTEAQIIRRSQDNTLSEGIWSVVHALRTAVESTIRAALRGRL
ncbi:hypothetical protein [Corallococcus coralloides]|nr:hypothetical protein [Corallococcus coralloides]